MTHPPSPKSTPDTLPGSLIVLVSNDSSVRDELELRSRERARTQLLNELWSPHRTPPPVRWDQADIRPYMFVSEALFAPATVAAILKVPVANLPHRQPAWAYGWGVCKVGRQHGLVNKGWKHEAEELGLAVLAPGIKKLSGYVFSMTPNQFRVIRPPENCDMCKFMVYVRTEGGLKPAKAFGWKIDVKGAQQQRDIEEVEAKRNSEEIA